MFSLFKKRYFITFLIKTDKEILQGNTELEGRLIPSIIVMEKALKEKTEEELKEQNKTVISVTITGITKL